MENELKETFLKGLNKARKAEYENEQAMSKLMDELTEINYDYQANEFHARREEIYLLSKKLTDEYQNLLDNVEKFIFVDDENKEELADFILNNKDLL